MKFITHLFSQSFEELAKCSQNMSCGQCAVSKHLAYRHILKSIVKKLEEKNHKFKFVSSHAICRAAPPEIEQEFTEFSEFRETDKSLKHKLG